jgi:hypothetical protein
MDALQCQSLVLGASHQLLRCSTLLLTCPWDGHQHPLYLLHLQSLQDLCDNTQYIIGYITCYVHVFTYKPKSNQGK